MFRTFRFLLRLFGIVLLLAYFAGCGVVLGARYWILPNIDAWRPQIAQYLSSRLGVDIHAGHIAAGWKGLNPHIALTDVSLSSPGLTAANAGTASIAQPPEHTEPGLSPSQLGQGGALHIPSLYARLDWRSLFQLKPVFVNLEASGVNIDLRRDTQGRLHALGHMFDPGAASTSDDFFGKLVGWLATQNRIALNDSTVRWTDDSRAAAPLQLDHLTLAFVNDGDVHEFSLSAMPPSRLGGALTATGLITALDDRRRVTQKTLGLSLPDMDAQVYVSVDRLRPGAWSPWVDLPATMAAGQVSGQARVEIDDGRVQALTTDVVLSDGNWHPGHGVQLAAQRLQLYLDGPLDDYLRLFAPGAQRLDTAATQSGLSYRLLTRGLQVTADYVFDHPLSLGNVAARGVAARERGGGLSIGADEAFIANADARARVQGSWREGGSSAAGVIDLKGLVDHARIASIASYLPQRVDADASAWLEHGLVAGDLHQAQLVLRGDLMHFPFQEHPQAGDFMVSGNYDGAIIDYLPARGGELGWPRLEAMRGNAILRRADLSVIADEAIMQTTPGKVIQLRDVRARIANLEHDPVLDVKGATHGAADTYLSLMTHTPLGGMLDHVFDQARASGQWEVPLSLTIPLTRGEDTEVDGTIRFAGNMVRLAPEMPALSDTQGALDFSHHSAIAKGIKGRFLDGPMSITGQVGAPGQSLRLQGRLSADALAQVADAQGMKRLTGHAPYTAVLERTQSKGFTLTLTSDLKGLAADLPEPLGKSVDAVVPLSAVWKTGAQPDQRRLEVEVGRDIHAQLLHRDRKNGNTPFFYAGAVGINEPARVPDAGISLDVRYPSIAFDAWRQVKREFDKPLDKAAGQQTDAANRPAAPPAKRQSAGVFPPLAQFRLQARTVTLHGMTLDKATLTAQQTEPGQWRADISSTQTAGTVRWTESGGRIQGPVDAAFDRLDLGSVQPDDAARRASDESATDGVDTASEEDNPLALDEALDLPAVNLHIKRLRLYGHHVGELSLTGVNESHGQSWGLEQFQLTSPHAKMSGSGRWRLSGPQRGLMLNAHADVNNLGNYLNDAGYHDILIDGRGTMDGQIEWRNMPWAFSRSDVGGALKFDLAKGRFSGMNSHSARLLELLSLQSVKRLAKLDFDPGSLAREGFPFDTLRGSAIAQDGILHTDDYRIVGPAGTIVLEGNTNLVDESLDLQAVVVPNLDVSGAAIAAGIVLNPIVGVGAFLAQWLLQAPLSQAMAAQYHITGSWDNPDIQDVTPSPASKRPAAREEPTP